MQPRALGTKVSDEFVAPLCRTHHRAVHRVRDERGWWKQAGIDAVEVARKMWRNSRSNVTWPRTKCVPGCGRKHYEATGAAAGAGAIRPALDLLEARAQFEAPQRAIHLRVAEHDGRNLFGPC